MDVNVFMSGFKLPPISTLAGTTIGNYIKVLQKGKIDRQYYLMTVITFLIIVIATPFHIWARLRFWKVHTRQKETTPPIFILGHWRSGTTFLHNVLCKDPRAAYLTTYHSLFPNNLGSKLLFRTFMRLNMPDKRPSDNVKLNVDYPQEDDFALGNSCDVSYYNFFYFPQNYRQFYEEAIHMRISQKRKERWQQGYKTLLAKAIVNTSGERLVIKNPVNTGRVGELLALYPQAKFIYIYRNPYVVFLSTQKFFRSLCPTLWFHSVSDDFIDDLIFNVFSRLIEDYERQKHLIPSENLMEVRFEHFEISPIKTIESVYGELLGEEFDDIVKGPISAYLDDLKGYRKNTYQIERKYYERIQREWGFFLRDKQYELPDNIKVID